MRNGGGYMGEKRSALEYHYVLSSVSMDYMKFAHLIEMKYYKDVNELMGFTNLRTPY